MCMWGLARKAREWEEQWFPIFNQSNQSSSLLPMIPLLHRHIFPVLFASCALPSLCCSRSVPFLPCVVHMTQHSQDTCSRGHVLLLPASSHLQLQGGDARPAALCHPGRAGQLRPELARLTSRKLCAVARCSSGLSGLPPPSAPFPCDTLAFSRTQPAPVSGVPWLTGGFAASMPTPCRSLLQA